MIVFVVCGMETQGCEIEYNGGVASLMNHNKRDTVLTKRRMAFLTITVTPNINDIN